MNSAVLSAVTRDSELETPAINPANGQQFGSLKNTAPETFPAVFGKARAAQRIWAQKSYEQRYAEIKKMQHYIREHSDDLAAIISLSNGKTRQDALVSEVLPCALACEWYGKNAAKVLKSERREMSHIMWMGKRSEITYEPLGVVGIISPWNYPFSIPFEEVVMGLMAGNAIVLKVAAATPLVGKAIEDIVSAADLPEGLFQHIVGSGSDISTAMFENGINKLFFTGSVPAGKQLMAQAAQTLTPVSLELGGNDPMVVLEDADLQRAASGAAWAGLSNTGQSCGGVERIYVHESVYDRFVELLSKEVSAMKHGAPTAAMNVDMGALSTAKQQRTIETHLQDALEKGARITAQSQRVGNELGFYHPATVLVNVNHSMLTMQEETFGPLLPVMSFKTEDEAVALANDSSMALSASVWTKNLKRGRELAKRIESGVVAINDHLYTHGMPDLPWGGPKESGIGRTHGPEGLLEMAKPKVINWDFTQPKQNLWWGPQNAQSYALMSQTIRLAAPKSVFETIVVLLKILPTMVKKALVG
jgi:acyl-CoA reductase-like NAD-dependent aldehyde dehydrogenase